MLSTAISAMSPYSKEESITWFHLKGTLSFALEDAKDIVAEERSEEMREKTENQWKIESRRWKQRQGGKK